MQSKQKVHLQDDLGHAESHKTLGSDFGIARYGHSVQSHGRINNNARFC